MAFKLKLPGIGKGKAAADSTTIAATTVMDHRPATPARSAAGKGAADLTAFPLAFLSRFPMTKQLQILGSVLILLVVLMAALIVRDNRESAFSTTYVGAAGELRGRREHGQ